MEKNMEAVKNFQQTAEEKDKLFRARIRIGQAANLALKNLSKNGKIIFDDFHSKQFKDETKIIYKLLSEVEKEIIDNGI